MFCSFHFYGLECHRFTRTMPLVLSRASLSQGLTQSKTLDCGGSGELNFIALLELHNLTNQVVCMVAELFLLPKQNFKSLNSRRRLVSSAVVPVF